MGGEASKQPQPEAKPAEAKVADEQKEVEKAAHSAGVSSAAKADEAPAAKPEAVLEKPPDAGVSAVKEDKGGGVPEVVPREVIVEPTASAPEVPKVEEAKPKSEAKGKGTRGKDGEGKKARGKGAGKAAKEGKGKEGKEGKGKDSKGKGKSKKGKPQELYSGPTGSGEGYRLNVKNIAEDVTTDTLTEWFKEHGTVADCAIKKKDDGKSRGFGYVTMATEEEAMRAMAVMNGKEMRGKKLLVVPAERRPLEEPAGGKDAKGKGAPAIGKGSMDVADHYAYLQQQQMNAYMQYYNYWMHAAAAAQMPMHPLWPPFGMEAAAAADALGVSALTAVPPPPDREFEGSLKSLSAKHGHGFIVCDEINRLYGRDVYLPQDLVPEGAKRLDRLSFTITLNDKGHPRASSASIAMACAPFVLRCGMVDTVGDFKLK